MKDISHDLSRTGRAGYPRRVHRRNHEALSEMLGPDGGVLPERRRATQKSPTRGENGRTNWRVRHYDTGEIVAVEPNRDFEHTFDGGDDPFMAALEFAAAELRKVNGDG